MSSIEKIHDLKRIREIKTKYGFNLNCETEIEKKIFEHINQPLATVKQRISGIENEDEFFLILLSLIDVEQVTPLSQKQLKNHKKYTIPDFLIGAPVPKIILKKDEKMPLVQRMFIEVKKCPKDELCFKISEEASNKLINYSLLYSLPMYIAIKMNCKAHKGWLLSPLNEILSKSQKGKFTINGRKQEGYSINLTELIKIDYSGLWLNNFSLIIEKGTIIKKTYSKNSEGLGLVNESYGNLIKEEIIYGENKFEIDFSKEDDTKKRIITSTLINFFCNGNETINQSGIDTEVSIQIKDNLFFSFLDLIFNSYFNLRKQFSVTLGDTDTTLEYYLNNFSDFDRNLIGYIHHFYEDINSSKVFKQVRMLPEKFFPKKEEEK